MSRASRFVWIKMPRPIRFACRSASRASRFVWIKICNGQARRGMEAGHELRASCGLKFTCQVARLTCLVSRASRFVWIKIALRKPRRACRVRHELRASCGLKSLHIECGTRCDKRHELRASCGLKYSRRLLLPPRQTPRASRFVWIKMKDDPASLNGSARHELRASCGLKFDTLRLGLYPFGHELRASCGLKCLWTDLRKMA